MVEVPPFNLHHPPPTSTGYQSNQWLTFSKNVLFAGARKSWRKSPVKERVPSTPSKSSRPWLHTRYRVEPGWYSHRRTVFELKNLTSNPPGLFVTAVSP